MISTIKHSGSPFVNVDTVAVCLSTDEKPVDILPDTNIVLRNGMLLREMDTKKTFMYDETNKTWLEQ